MSKKYVLHILEIAVSSLRMSWSVSFILVCACLCSVYWIFLLYNEVLMVDGLGMVEQITSYYIPSVKNT